MCGIIGAIGKTKNPGLSTALATALIEEIETRGTDATGFYAVNDDDTYNFAKLDIPASKFVKTNAWKNQQKYTFTHLVAHARMKTHGSELMPINNHPHISENNLLALVHNGVVGNFQSIANKNNIRLLGQCDSEILLKLVETKEDPDQGVENVFREMKHSMSSFACLMIDDRKEPFLYAFRNNSNPLCFVDLSEELGQYFFCSTPQIWNKVLHKLNLERLSSIPALSVPGYEVWKITKDLKITKTSMEDCQSMTSLSSDFMSERSWPTNWRNYQSLTSMHDGVIVEEDDDDEPVQGNFGKEWESVQEVDQKINSLKETLAALTDSIQTRAYTHNKINYENLSDELDGIQQTFESFFTQEQIDYTPNAR